MRRIDSIVSQMLRFAGPAKPTFSALLMRDVLEQSCRLIEHQLAKKQIHLQKTFLASPDLMRGDSYQLEQAFLNLILNAVEALSESRETSRALLIKTQRDGPGGVLVAVRDSGPGLKPESMDRLFDAFYTTKPDGMGMGLSICRSIIEAHGGRIWATANLPRGAVLQFTLPLQE